MRWDAKRKSVSDAGGDDCSNKFRLCIKNKVGRDEL